MALPPEYVEQINKASAAWKQARSDSSGASVSFHEKLAVITAGSLALAVSGAAAIYQKQPLNIFAASWLGWSVTISVICLWLSLVAAIVHNFIESHAIRLDAEITMLDSHSQMLDAVIKITQEARGPDKIVVDEPTVAAFKKLNITMKADSEPLQKRATRLRGWELPLSVVAISLFAVGYLPVVLYIILLMHNIS